MRKDKLHYINWGVMLLVVALYIGLRQLGFTPFTYYFLLMPFYIGFMIILKIVLINWHQKFPIGRHQLSYVCQLVYAYGYFINEQAKYDIYCQENNLPMDLEGLAVVIIGIFLHIVLYVFIGVVSSILYIVVKRDGRKEKWV